MGKGRGSRGENGEDNGAREEGRGSKRDYGVSLVLARFFIIDFIARAHCGEGWIILERYDLFFNN